MTMGSIQNLAQSSHGSVQVNSLAVAPSSFSQVLMRPSQWGMRQVSKLCAPYQADTRVHKTIELVIRVFFALLGAGIALLASPLYAVGSRCWHVDKNVIPLVDKNLTPHVDKILTPDEQFLADVQNLQTEIESLRKMDTHSACWKTECTRLSDKAELILRTHGTTYNYDWRINNILILTHYLLIELAEKVRYGYRITLYDIESAIKELKKDPDIFVALLGSLKSLVQPFLGKDKSIEECIQEIPLFIEKLKELQVLSIEDPKWKQVAKELSEEMHICREHWDLKFGDENSESSEYKIFNHSTFFVSCLPKDLTDMADDRQDDTENVSKVTSNQQLFASLADETAQLKKVFLGLRKPKENLRREFEKIVQKQFVENAPVSLEQCKSFVYGANFIADSKGGVNPSKIFPRLESILGYLESDDVILKGEIEQAPPGFTPVALGLSSTRHSYTLLKTPTGAKHAFSNVKGLEEGYLGPKCVSSEITKIAFEGNMEPLFRHPHYRDSQIPLIQHVVYVKDAYVDRLTQSLDTFHDLPWFDNKCVALRAMTLALVMIRANQIAVASKT